ncbi:MAG: hypothetical protein B6I20_10895 [Bacteroidetes bacterium 4572_117]|nr:MAG: hypothetical protein B6I20_10895 [Bacteroidetes bacterium 4572_117]
MVKGKEIKTVTKIKGNQVEVIKYIDGKIVQENDISEKKKKKMLKKQKKEMGNMKKKKNRTTSFYKQLVFQISNLIKTNGI